MLTPDQLHKAEQGGRLAALLSSTSHKPVAQLVRVQDEAKRRPHHHAWAMPLGAENNHLVATAVYRQPVFHRKAEPSLFFTLEPSAAMALGMSLIKAAQAAIAARGSEAVERAAAIAENLAEVQRMHDGRRAELETQLAAASCDVDRKAIQDVITTLYGDGTAENREGLLEAVPGRSVIADCREVVEVAPSAAPPGSFQVSGTVTDLVVHPRAARILGLTNAASLTNVLRDDEVGMGS